MKPAAIRRKKIIIPVLLIVFCLLAVCVLFHTNPAAIKSDEIFKKTISVAIIVLSAFFIVVKYDKIGTLPVEIWQNRRLILKLAGNDVK